MGQSRAGDWRARNVRSVNVPCVAYSLKEQRQARCQFRDGTGPVSPKWQNVNLRDTLHWIYCTGKYSPSQGGVPGVVPEVAPATQ